MSKTSTSIVEKLDPKDVRKAAVTLYHAFDNDDVAAYCTRHLENEPEKRKKVDIMLFEAYVNLFMLRGMAFVIKGENHEQKEVFETVSLWEIPNCGSMDDYLTLLRTGFAKLGWYAGAEGRRRVFQVLFKVLHDNVDLITKRDPAHDNMYTLIYLGSTPDARGKGNVRKIFDHVFENYVDRDNAITYLESSNLVNTPIYEKFGFRAVCDIWLGDKNDESDRARMDIMIRGPQGAEWKYLEEVRKERAYVVPENSVLK